MTKKKTDREEELLIAGINARIDELKKHTAVATSNQTTDEKFVETLIKIVDELKELLEMKEKLT